MTKALTDNSFVKSAQQSSVKPPTYKGEGKDIVLNKTTDSVVQMVNL